METVVLLGAGASQEAGVPVTGEMTKRIAALLERDPKARRSGLHSALHFIIGQMVAHDTAHGAGAFDSLDVERVLSAVRLLAERADLEVTPFVASWHPAVDSFDRTRSPEHIPFFDSEFRKELARGSMSRLEDLLRRLVRSEIQAGSSGVYRRLLARMTVALRELVTIADSTDVTYLVPLVQLAREQGVLTVATLNYDVSIETLCASEGMAYSTGITGWMDDGLWTWPDDGIRLLKLHGSIDWSATQELRADQGVLPAFRVTASVDTNHRATPAVIFGQREKLRAQGPFLELLAQFASHLGSASQLLAVGYSFRDDHVNEHIRRWLNGSPDRHLTVIDPGFPELSGGRRGDFRWELLTHLFSRNVGSNPEAFPPRLSILRKPASEGLPQAVADALSRPPPSDSEVQSAEKHDEA